MAIRLLVILSLFVQPMLLGFGHLTCTAPTPAAAADLGCCQAVTTCCISKVQIHHCGQSAALCQCGQAGPDQPKQPPAPQSRASDILAAILPRLIALAYEPPLPPTFSISTSPVAKPLSGADLRAHLCVWLT